MYKDKYSGEIYLELTFYSNVGIVHCLTTINSRAGRTTGQTKRTSATCQQLRRRRRLCAFGALPAPTVWQHHFVGERVRDEFVHPALCQADRRRTSRSTASTIVLIVPEPRGSSCAPTANGECDYGSSSS